MADSIVPSTSTPAATAATAAPATVPATAPTTPAAAPSAPRTPAAPPALFGHADHMAGLSDDAFADAFGLGELLGTDGARAAEPAAAAEPARTPERTPVVDARGNVHEPETGRFAAKTVEEAQAQALADATQTEAAAGDAADAGAAAGGEETPDETPTDTPEATPAEPAAAARPTPPATKFTVKQGEAEVDVPSDLTIAFRANGKDLALPLDRVVRLAQSGAYNEEKEQQYQTIHARNQQLEPFARETFQRAAYLEQFLESVLAGGEQADQILYDARLRHAEERSPEAENRRLRAQLQQAHQQMTQAPAAAPVAPEAQFAQVLTPKLAQLVQQHPGLSEQDVWQHFERLAAPYLDRSRGVLDPQHYQTVLTLVDGALGTTLELLADHRRETQSALAKTQQELAATKGQLRLVKRDAAGALKPTPATGSAPRTGQPPAAAPRANARAEDVNEALLDQIAHDLVGQASA